MQNSLSFDDVLLEPKYSDIESRGQIDIGNHLSETAYLELPVISSPMDTVTEDEMSWTMCDEGGLGVLHRYNTIEEQVALVKKRRCFTAAAIGVTGEYEERACALVDAGVRYLCLDVAHGHHILVKNALKTLRDVFGSEVHLMAGNVATLDCLLYTSDAADE